MQRVRRAIEQADSGRPKRLLVPLLYVTTRALIDGHWQRAKSAHRRTNPCLRSFEETLVEIELLANCILLANSRCSAAELCLASRCLFDTFFVIPLGMQDTYGAQVMQPEHMCAGLRSLLQASADHSGADTVQGPDRHR